MTAIAAVDTALWDIKGKVLGAPVYQLLGGQARDAVMVYGHANGESIDDTVAAAAEYVRLGYKAVRLQCGIPGVPNAPTPRPTGSVSSGFGASTIPTACLSHTSAQRSWTPWGRRLLSASARR